MNIYYQHVSILTVALASELQEWQLAITFALHLTKMSKRWGTGQSRKTPKEHTNWSENVFKKWAEAQNKEFVDFVAENPQFPSVPGSLDGISIAEMNYWLSKFALEVRIIATKYSIVSSVA